MAETVSKKGNSITKASTPSQHVRNSKIMGCKSSKKSPKENEVEIPIRSRKPIQTAPMRKKDAKFRGENDDGHIAYV